MLDTKLSLLANVLYLYIVQYAASLPVSLTLYLAFSEAVNTNHLSEFSATVNTAAGTASGTTGFAVTVHSAAPFNASSFR